MNYSTALSSIGLGLFFVREMVAILKTIRSNKVAATFNISGEKWVCGGLLASFLVIVCVSVIQGNEISNLGSYLQIKLPLLLVFGLLGFGKGTIRPGKWSWLIYLLPLFWIIAASCVHYFQHFEFYSQMVLESKPIPMFTKIYHIEFGAITAIMILLFLEQSTWDKSSISYKKLANVVALLTAIGLHVLALRTGIVMLYVGLLFWGWKYFKSMEVISRKWHWAIPVSLVVAVATLYSLPSVKHRMANTSEDISIIVQGGDSNHRSLGQRVEAWRAAVNAIKANPWGVGVDGEFDALMRGYEESKTKLLMVHRIGIHNQFLQMGVQGGWLAMGLMVVALSWAFLNWNSGYWILVLMSGLMVESFMERQSGILISIVILLAAAQNWRQSRFKPQEIE